MTSWTKPRTWVAGQAVTAAALNTDLRDGLKNLDERLTLHGITDPSTLNKVKGALCGVRLGDSTTQNISDDTEEALTWDTEDHDSDGFHDATYPARVTIPSGLGGYYLVSAAVRWPSSAATLLRMWVEDDAGTDLFREETLPAGSGVTHQTITGLVGPLVPGDWLVVRVWHNAGSTVSVTKNVVSSFLVAYRIFAT